MFIVSAVQCKEVTVTVSWAVYIHPPPGKPTKTGPESQKDVVSLPLDSSISGEIDSGDEYFTAHGNSPLKQSHRGQKSAWIWSLYFGHLWSTFFAPLNLGRPSLPEGPNKMGLVQTPFLAIQGHLKG